MRRTALVTGANRGIGVEVCRRLAADGHDVILTARDPVAGREAARELGVRFEMLDVADGASVTGCARRAGPVAILVNNAGVFPPGTVLDAPSESWREAIETNFLGALRCCRAFVPAMVERGYGRVVNVSSGYGAFAEGLDGPAPYAVSKAALNALTKKLASEVSGDVKVNAVCPGWVRTRMGGEGAELPVEEAVETILWLSSLPADGPNGGFFRDRAPIPW